MTGTNIMALASLFAGNVAPTAQQIAIVLGITAPAQITAIESNISTIRGYVAPQTIQLAAAIAPLNTALIAAGLPANVVTGTNIMALASLFAGNVAPTAQQIAIVLGITAPAQITAIESNISTIRGYVAPQTIQLAAAIAPLNTALIAAGLPANVVTGTNIMALASLFAGNVAPTAQQIAIVLGITAPAQITAIESNISTIRGYVAPQTIQLAAAIAPLNTALIAAGLPANVVTGTNIMALASLFAGNVAPTAQQIAIVLGITAPAQITAIESNISTIRGYVAPQTIQLAAAIAPLNTALIAAGLPANVVTGTNIMALASLFAGNVAPTAQQIAIVLGITAPAQITAIESNISTIRGYVAPQTIQLAAAIAPLNTALIAAGLPANVVTGTNIMALASLFAGNVAPTAQQIAIVLGITAPAQITAIESSISTIRGYVAPQTIQLAAAHRASKHRAHRRRIAGQRRDRHQHHGPRVAIRR